MKQVPVPPFLKDAVLGWTDLAQSLIDAAKQPEP